jgi:hypothetical protein
MFDNVFIVIDALDECTTTVELMEFLENVIRWKHMSLHLLVTSRRVIEIEEVLEGSVDASQSLAISNVDEDIKLYVSQILQKDKSFTRWDQESLLEINKVLTEGEHGI